MHEYHIPTRDAILEYLKQEFPVCEITEEEHDDSYCFRLKDKASSYYLRVMFSAVLDVNANSIMSLLEQYAAANTMRGLGDFPVVVTEQGCMFGSP